MRPRIIIALSILLIAFNVSVRAQSVYGEYATREGLRLLEIGKALARMPETGAAPENYVPPHWTIADRAEGDLNADGIKDFAITLMLDEKDTKYIESLKQLNPDDSWIDRAFIIAVVDSRGDRKLHLNSVNYNLYGDEDAPARNGDARDQFKLSMKKNVLAVNVQYGGSLRSDATFLFREEKPTGGDLLLIGFEYESYCVTPSNDCPGWRMSENYLTGARVETNYKIQGAKRVGADKQTVIPPVKVEFMDVRLNERNRKGDVRPF
ncbi:MAG: hypothetical protein M3362_19735 [Acidobacteriota bacterium]|nr:hypothetical protein [Acidobacteriota bacterium]